ncbi:MAG: sodium-dependent transporter [Proteobacteria bacterium]|nr:sodium-dependent transporter [Pseudomonadota bacterium]
MSKQRKNWQSKLGFILAASGSAIGLGNIVFFSSNAYQYGGGAFYLPYFFALFFLGLPIMIVEFGMGTMTHQSFPLALRKLVGRRGEFVGWWAIFGSTLITMYYVVILGWALGMLVGTFGSLFEPGITAPFTPFTEPTAEPSAIVYFFDMIASWNPVIYIAIIWFAMGWILRHGTASIERAVRWFVPLMWLFMIGLAVRGLTLEGGLDGIMYLFTPDFAGIADVNVWRGAFSQMFFSLSLGMGIMTAYASYLPKEADQVNNSMLVSFLNCGFEFIAGTAIFALLFVFALNPAGSTLSLSFFVIPQGINELSTSPWIVRFFGFTFFLLMVMAGLTSAVSLAEAFVSALIDKLGITRMRALTLVTVAGAIGSFCFSLPQIIDVGLSGNGTLGLTLLDVADHWVFNYSLLFVGLSEVILIGWVLGAGTLREAINQHARLKLGVWFEVLIRYFIPGLLIFVIVLSLKSEFSSDAKAGVPYGSAYDIPGYEWIPYAIPLIWLVGSIGFAWYISGLKTQGGAR